MSGPVRRGWRLSPERNDAADWELEDWVDRLEEGGFGPFEVSPGKWKSRCPGHKGAGPSLSFSAGDEQPVVAWCFADHGCEFANIVDGLVNTTPPTHQPSRSYMTERKKGTKKAKGTRTRTHEYVDEKGRLLRRVKRYDNPKSFSQEILDGRMVLYHLPEVIEWVEAGETIYLCEGESDAEAALEADLAATCTPQGAQSRRLIDQTMVELLMKAEKVVIVGDTDGAGIKGAMELYDVLWDAGVNTEVLYPPEPYIDLREMLEDGGAIGDVVSEPSVDDGFPTLSNKEIESIPKPEWLVENYLVEGTVGMLYGKWRHKKTFLALDWALSVAMGVPWLERKVNQGKVLYVVAEGASGIGDRTRAWREHHEVDDAPDIAYLTEPVNVFDDKQVALLEAKVEREGYALVVIDTLNRCSMGAVENSAEDMGKVVHNAERLARLGACVLLVHHPTKTGESSRGSGAMEAGLEFVLRFQDEKLKVEKMKNAVEVDEITLVPKLVGPSLVLQEADPEDVDDDQFDTSLDRVVHIFQMFFGNVGATKAEMWRTATGEGVPSTTFYRCWNRMVGTGRIVNKGTEKSPKWYLR